MRKHMKGEAGNPNAVEKEVIKSFSRTRDKRERGSTRLLPVVS